MRNTLKAGLCDLIPGVPSGFEMALATRPYYRSTYVFVSRRDRKLGLRSLDDPRLARLRIGVQMIGNDGANSPRPTGRPRARPAARGGEHRRRPLRLREQREGRLGDGRRHGDRPGGRDDPDRRPGARHPGGGDGRVYVARSGLLRQTPSPLDAILAIDPAARKVAATLPAGPGAWGVAIAPR